MAKSSLFPLISVIIPVYNVKDYVEKCLLSICRQTYQNLEIIVVDDGSTDGSGEICDSLAKLDARIKVFHQSNEGQSVARNSGLSMATGDLIGFVDSDDWIDEDMYEFLYRLMIKNDADISVCSHYLVKSGKVETADSFEKIVVFTKEEAMQALIKDKLLRNYIWDKLYKRYLFDQLRFPVGRLYEDVAISYKIFAQAKRIVLGRSPKYYYLVREGSTVQGKYDPILEYHFFLGVYEQDQFVRNNDLCKVITPYVLRRGIHLINHIMMVKPSFLVKSIIQDVLSKMHEYDHISFLQLGFALGIKRFFIYRHIKAYGAVYRFVRLFCNSKHF